MHSAIKPLATLACDRLCYELLLKKDCFLCISLSHVPGRNSVMVCRLNSVAPAGLGAPIRCDSGGIKAATHMKMLVH